MFVVVKKAYINKSEKYKEHGGLGPSSMATEI